MTLRVHKLSFALLAAAAFFASLALVGCGSGDDEDQPASLPKSQYAKKADAICSKTEGRQEKLVNQFGEQTKKNPETPSGTEELIIFAAVPPLELQAKELSQLPPPEEEAAKAKEYLHAFEKGIEATAQEPQALLVAEPGPFTKAEEAAKGFGFKVCSGA